MMPKTLNALAQFETLAERWLETGFVRLFRGRLHRAELAEQLARALEDGQKEEPNGICFAPDDYQIFLHPDDFARLGSQTTRLEMERTLANQLIQMAQQNDLKLMRRPQVHLRATNNVPPRQVRVRARLTTLPSPADQPFETREIDVPESQAEKPRSADTIFFLQMDDRQIPLTVPTFNLGRNMDNDLVIDHPRVSRHHAQLCLREGHWWLIDLNSANGTAINGQPVSETNLYPGDCISLAGVQVLFASGTPPAG